VKPLEALAVLDQATDPRNSGKLSRTDYANTQIALQVLAEALSPKDPPIIAPDKP
jgi:hypothetical protein